MAAIEPRSQDWSYILCTQPGLEVGMLLRRVRTAVREETGGQQVPWENGSIEGEFYFNGMSGAPPVTPLASSPPTSSTSTGTQVAVGVYPQQPQAPPDTIVGKDGAEMVLVPAGEFVMGSDGDELDRLKASRESFGDEIPRHRVCLNAFYIDKYEVTNARFQQFVQVTGHRTHAELDVRAPHRGRSAPANRSDFIGFRCVKIL